MDVAWRFCISDSPWIWPREADRIPHIALERLESGSEEVECIAPLSVGRTAVVCPFQLLDRLPLQERERRDALCHWSVALDAIDCRSDPVLFGLPFDAVLGDV